MLTHSHIQILSQVTGIFESIGCGLDDASLISDVLVRSELRGIPSHGLQRVKDYHGLWKKGRLNPRPEITILHETPCTALMDGDNSIGMLPANRAMEVAISKASEVGTGWVAVRNSNHFGIAAYYSMMALPHDMIGISMTNANALVSPTFSVSRLLGTNPLSVSIPAGEESPFVADFATTPVSRGKLAIMERSGDLSPSGYVQDKDGRPSHDPSVLKRGGSILPLGGDREHGSHKGYCMSAIIDIVSSVLSGANFGPFVPPQVSYLEPAKDLPGKGLGHFFGAMRIDAFQKSEEFKSMMDQWIRTFRSAKLSKGQNRVYIPGEIEREMENKLKVEGINIDPLVIDEIKMICKDTGTAFIL